MRAPPIALYALWSVLIPTAACDNGDEPAASAPAPSGEKNADADAKAEAKTNAKTEEPTEPEGSGNSKIFTKDDRKQRCTALTPELLAELFDFPLERLDKSRPKPGKQRCNYHWREGDEVFFAQLGVMWISKDVESAKAHYAKGTTSKTQAEIEAEMKTVKKMAAKDETLKTATGKKLTTTATTAFEAMTGDNGVTYKTVPGIGDEAKVSNRDGSVWLRVGNAHLTMYAYRGPNKPPLTNGGRPVTDIAKIMAHEREWTQSTLAQRKEASLKLAKAYVPLLEKLAE